MMFLKEYRPILVPTSMKCLNKKLNGKDPATVRILHKLQSSFLKKDIEQQVQNEDCNYKKVLHSEGNTVDWSMCIICQQTKYKGSEALLQVLTEIAQSTLRKAAEVLKDQEMQSYK